MDAFILVGDDGMPVGGVDRAAALEHARRLALALATEVDENERLRIFSEAMHTEGGLYGFAPVAVAALQMIVDNVLHPILARATDAGSDVRDWIPRMLA